MPNISEADFYVYKSGVYDLNLFYSTIRKWYSENKFTPFEKVYKDKVKDFGTEIVSEWTAFRKLTGYIRYWVDVEVKSWNTQEVETVINGKKVKRTMSRIRFHVSSKIETDWNEQWSENKVLEKFRDFYEKYILKKKIQTVYEPEIWRLTSDLHAKIKQALEMEAEKVG